jgi:hypothetical protein
MTTFRDRSASVRSHVVDFGASNKPGGGTSFKVFQDNQENDGYNLDRDVIPNEKRRLPRDQDRRKENTVSAEQWNLRGGLHSTSRHAVMPSSQPSQPVERNIQEFSVFVDEDCAADDRRKELLQHADEDRRRRHRDERTFREIAAGERVVELLQKDPLRYLKDPSKRQKDEDQAKKAHDIPEEKVDAPYAKNPPEYHGIVGRVGPGLQGDQSKKASFLGQSLITDSSGCEQCYNEYRAFCGRYATLSEEANFNALQKYKATVDDSVMDIDDSTTASDISMEHAIEKNNSVLGTSREEDPRRVLFGSSASFDRPERSINVSQCSSTINPAGAVGIYDPEEETMNTKLAFREMSMMFFSPATGLMQSSKKPKTGEYMSGIIGRQTSFESQQPELGYTNDDLESEEATFATVLDLVGSSGRNVNNSLVQSDAFETENDGERHPSSKAAEPRDETDPHALRHSTKEDNATATSCRQGVRRAFGQIAQEDLVHDHRVRAVDECPGFTGYQDSPEGAVSISNNNKRQLLIHQDAELTSTKAMRPGGLEGSKSHAYPKGSGFDIFDEREQRGSPGAARQATPGSRHPPRPRIAEDRTAQVLRSAAKYSRQANSIRLGKAGAEHKPATGGFSIFVDNTSPTPEPSVHDDGENTESLSIYKQLMADMPTGISQTNAKAGFPIFQDMQAAESPASDCNTAVLAIFNDLIADEAGTHTRSSMKTQKPCAVPRHCTNKDENTTASFPNFDEIMQSDESCANTKSSMDTQKSHAVPRHCNKEENTTTTFPNFDEILKALREDDGPDTDVSKLSTTLPCNYSQQIN